MRSKCFHKFQLTKRSGLLVYNYRAVVFIIPGCYEFDVLSAV